MKNDIILDKNPVFNRISSSATKKSIKSRKTKSTGFEPEALDSDIRDYEKNLVKFVLDDFESKKDERKPFELAFALNMNFVLGNQHVFVAPSGEISELEKTFVWETRETFNHIAPIVETRLAKLSRVRPSMHVRPTGAEEKDIQTAKMSTNILHSVASELKLDELISEATTWSEICGTAFFKLAWNSNKGRLLGEKNDIPIHEGDIDISVCSPFELFFDSNSAKNISDCNSIVHAKAYSVENIFNNWGVLVDGSDIDVFSLDSNFSFGGISGFANSSKLVKTKKHNSCLVIERYEKPSVDFPGGRLLIVAGDKLLFEGELPFLCGENGIPAFPFVRQISIASVGSIWGTSLVERCIPVQRAYNAIKNRKHEFLTRLSAGVLAVEDGSVDIDNLEEEGLAPGKILVYRAGSNLPKFMDAGQVPSDFNIEENRLLNEFVTLSGVSEFMRDSSVSSSVSSGVALGLLVEQDDTRLSQTAENIRFAVREIGKMILRLFKQFADKKRLCKMVDENGDVEVFCFEKSEITSDDVVLDTSNELSESPASRKAMVFDLLKNGLLLDENGRLSNRNRAKVLDALGFGNWESSKDLATLHSKRALQENLGFLKLDCLEIDDHDIHIEEHTKFVISGSCDKNSKLTKQIVEHILVHKNMLIQNALQKNVTNLKD